MIRMIGAWMWFCLGRARFWSALKGKGRAPRERGVKKRGKTKCNVTYASKNSFYVDKSFSADNGVREEPQKKLSTTGWTGHPTTAPKIRDLGHVLRHVKLLQTRLRRDTRELDRIHNEEFTVVVMMLTPEKSAFRNFFFIYKWKQQSLLRLCQLPVKHSLATKLRS